MVLCNGTAACVLNVKTANPGAGAVAGGCPQDVLQDFSVQAHAAGCPTAIKDPSR